MKLSQRLLLPALLLASPLSLAQTQAPAARAEASSQAGTVSIQSRGSLRDAIQEIARAGGLNVVVTGELDTPAEVYLQNVRAEQALRTVARAYSLHLEEDGGIFTLRPLSATEKALEAAAKLSEAKGKPAAPPPPAHPAHSAHPASPAPPAPVVAPVPPVPPELARHMAEVARNEERVKEAKERVRERMEKVRRSSRGSRDVVARGRSLVVREGEEVDSAVVYGGNLTVNGAVEDDAVVFGGNLEVNGRVDGDAHAFGGNVVLGPDAEVDGDVSAFGGSVIKQDGARVEGSTESFGGANIGKLVAGELKEGLKEAKSSRAERRQRRDSGFAAFLVWFAMLFGLGFLGQMFFPARMKELSAEIRTQPVKTGLVGLLAALAMIPITVVLTVTLIGIPVMLALWVVAWLTTALGFGAVASEIGLKLPVMRGRKTQAMVLALGLLVLLVVGHIPGVGPLVLTLATLVAFGAVIRTRFGTPPKGMPEPIIPDHSPV